LGQKKGTYPYWDKKVPIKTKVWGGRESNNKIKKESAIQKEKESGKNNLLVKEEEPISEFSFHSKFLNGIGPTVAEGLAVRLGELT